jgi:hypothetical protein
MSEKWPVSVVALLTRRFIFVLKDIEHVIWWLWLPLGDVSFCIWAQRVFMIISAFNLLTPSGYYMYHLL